ncbi:sulfite oxidase [Halovulum dunhuangense]|uniref:Sulfite oxidase n=2 Tax=Halovulum dunhuangense TaxID=1505036 RepID=A0A849L3P1_9RHOB|nr:sulfite oxidase [Halovulum dunhuangense]
MPASPFDGPQPRRETVSGVFSAEEVALANRNSGAMLELLALDVTPLGAHYLLTHFDVPVIDPDTHRLRFEGAFDAPFQIGLDEIRALPQVTMPVTLECAGNGRAGMDPRPFSMPWMYEAVGTAEWTGTPLAPLIERARPRAGVVDFAFEGADHGYDKGVGHAFGRSLTPAELAGLDVLLVHQMNGQPLAPQHGAPLRIVVPGWYGMASVKWLTSITALTERYQGFQQVGTYRFRQTPDEPGAPVTTIRVKSLMVPPGVPDWITRKRLLAPGPVTLRGRAWAGSVPVARVEVLLDGCWQEATLGEPLGRHAWTGWQIDWDAAPGHHVLACRATDADGNTQPLQPEWNLSGFANNAVQCVEVFVER